MFHTLTQEKDIKVGYTDAENDYRLRSIVK